MERQKEKSSTIIELGVISFITFSFILIFCVISAGTYYILIKPINAFKEKNVSLYYIEGVPVIVNVGELIHAYETDEQEANSKYAGRHISVTGQFSHLEKYENQTVFYIRDSKVWTSQALQCICEAPSTNLFKLNRGDVIKVGGILRGSVSFQTIVLVKPYITLIKHATSKEIK